MLAQTRPTVATTAGRPACAHRRAVVCLAKSRSHETSVAQRCATAMLSAAVATTMMLSPQMALAGQPTGGGAGQGGAPEPEQKSFGAERTKKLVNEMGTPEAARPDTMKTNVPFQAPGISQAPRGKGQLEGTSPLEVGKNVKKTIKEQFPDKTSKPFGISRGPLVKDAKKMVQPGRVQNMNKEGAFRYKKFYTEPAVAKAAGADPQRSAKRGVINGSFTTLFGGRNTSPQ